MNRLYFDGGASPNPGRMHVCIVLDDEPSFKWLDHGTNNEAEWLALCWGMMTAHEKGITELEIIGDSNLIINQANGFWKIKKPEFSLFKSEFDVLKTHFTSLTLRYEPRKHNVAGHYIETQLEERSQTIPMVTPQPKSIPQPKIGRQLSDEQAACLVELRNFVKSEQQVFTVHGLAGTGKTTALLEFATEQPMTLVAYTGKAASVLREKSGMDAKTIHNVIYTPEIDPKTGEVNFRKLPQNLQGYIIGVDESSMVNTYIAQDLLSTRAKIITFGDPGQLPPIEGEQYFHTPNYRFTEIHRQAQDSPIIRQAHLVRVGQNYSDDTDQFRIVRQLSDDVLLESDIVLCHTNKTRNLTNQRIRAHINRSDYPKAGETVVCLKNAHKYGLCNGAVYTLKKDFNPNGLATISLDINGDKLDIPSVAFAKNGEAIGEITKKCGRKLVSAFDFGYCLTVHKAQGSEWKHVTIIDEYFYEGRRTWLYTAITRASERITIQKSV